MEEKYVLTNGQTYLKSISKGEIKKTNNLNESKIFTSIQDVVPVKNKYKTSLNGYKVCLFAEEQRRLNERQYVKAKEKNMYVLKNSGSFYVGNGRNKTQDIIDAAKFSNKQLAEEYKVNHPSKTKGYEIYTISEVEDFLKNNSEIEKTTRKYFSQEERRIIYNKDKGHCYICGDFVDYDKFQIEHKIPLSKGGTNDMDNLYCSCEFCNQLKQSYLFDDFVKKINKIFLNQFKNKDGLLCCIISYILNKKEIHEK